MRVFANNSIVHTASSAYKTGCTADLISYVRVCEYIGDEQKKRTDIAVVRGCVCVCARACVCVCVWVGGGGGGPPTLTSTTQVGVPPLLAQCHSGGQPPPRFASAGI